ncbi:MAG TPA: chromosome segregation protein SMC, partial [Treponema sp.]|nr:chromosome segregation protein SMC [Treponema sp.]
FSETGKLVAQLESALGDYMKASPAFITEFLAPEGIMTKKRAIDSKIQENLTHIAAINAHIDELHAANAGLVEKINEYKETLGRLRINEVQMKEQISASEQQTSILRRSLTSQQNTLRDTDDELVNENKHAADLNDQISDVQDELAEIEQKGIALADELKTLDEGIAKCNSSVSGKQNALRKKQEEQNRCQEQYEKLTLSLASSDTEIRNVKQNFQDTHSRDLMEFEERMYKITTPSADIREKLTAAKDRLKDLGQVNLMAPEEFTEVKERYERQQANYEDTKKSLENLQRVSEEIKSKSSEMFLDTYNKIKKNFHNMFRRLFNGGRGELRLEDPENVLTSGIDIFAQPPGKKLENIALLSGGEKTMTAVALLFATYQVRPSPFCLLDEIDAALDDKNVSSFVTTLRSFANVSQYIVITHNKKTVMGASTMLGITMEESGVSKILALRLDKDIKLGAAIPEPDGDFVEEDVEPETAVIPPRPAKRIHTPDGSVIDPERGKQVRAEKELEKEAAEKVKSPEKKQPEEKKNQQEMKADSAAGDEQAGDEE